MNTEIASNPSVHETKTDKSAQPDLPVEASGNESLDTTAPAAVAAEEKEEPEESNLQFMKNEQENVNTSTQNEETETAEVSMDMAQMMVAQEQAVTQANHLAVLQAQHAFAQHHAAQMVVNQALTSQTSQTHTADGKPAPGTDEWLKQRRESHKEVERRRREVINTGIAELSKIVPNCSDRNKGGILHRAVQYIQQLKEAEQRNAERWTLDKMLADQAINDLTGYVEYLKSENEALRSQITQLGGEAPPRTQPPAPSVPPYHAHAMAAAMHPGYHPYFVPPPGHWPGAGPYPHPAHILPHPGPPQMPHGPPVFEAYKAVEATVETAVSQLEAPAESTLPSVSEEPNAQPTSTEQPAKESGKRKPEETASESLQESELTKKVRISEDEQINSVTPKAVENIPSSVVSTETSEKPEAVQVKTKETRKSKKEAGQNKK